MSTIREAIREQNRIKRMRMGQEAAELEEIPSLDGIRVAQVPLVERESQAGLIRAANLDVVDNSAGMQARNRAAVESDVWHSCREPGDLTKMVWESVDEMVEELEPSDIDYLFDKLTILMEYASPSLDGLTQQDLDQLKKDFGQIDWNELSGRQWSALKLCLSTLLPELLAARLSSSTYTQSLTTRTESVEST